MSVPLRYCDPRSVVLRDGLQGLADQAVARSRTTSSALKPIELDERAMSVLGLEHEPHSFIGTASDERVDRYDDVVVQRGGRLENYRANPVLLWNHNLDGEGRPVAEPPIGKTLAIWVEGPGARTQYDRIRSIRSFHRETNLSDEIYRLFMAGILRTTSIAFVPDPGGVEERKESKVGGLRFKSWEMREDSIVNIPANVGASAELKGLFDGEITRAIGEVPGYVRFVEQWLDTHPVGSPVELVPGMTRKTDSKLRGAYEVLHAGLKTRTPMVPGAVGAMPTAVPDQVTEQMIQELRALKEMYNLFEQRITALEKGSAEEEDILEDEEKNVPEDTSEESEDSSSPEEDPEEEKKKKKPFPKSAPQRVVVKIGKRTNK